MSDIFLSYASEDRARIQLLVTKLEEQGWSVWWDRELIVGPNFEERIEAELDQAKCVVIVWSTHSVESRWCRAEAHEGLERNILVPVLIDEVRPPLAFRGAHTAALTEWPNELGELDKALQGIGHCLGQPHTAPNQDSEGQHHKSSFKWFAAPIAVALLIALGWLFLNPSLEESDQATSAPTESIVDETVVSKQQTMTIAVLPLRNNSGDTELYYMGEAIAEEISGQLSGLDGARIISMNSSRKYANSNLDTRKIAEQLTATHIVEGSFSRSGDTLRAAVQLVDGLSGTEDWRGSFEQNLSDIEQIFAFYDDVSTELFRVLQGQGTEFAIAPPTQNVEAYHLFKSAWFQFKETSVVSRSLALINEALELDPNFSIALDSRAILLYLQAEYGQTPSKQGYERAKQAAIRALELNPNSARGYTVLGGVADRLELDFRKALEYFNQANNLQKTEARVSTGWWQDTLMNAGQFEEGLVVTQEMAAAEPGNANPLGLQARFLTRLGRTDEAREKLELSLRLGPNNRWVIANALQHYLFWLKDIERATTIINDVKDEALLPLTARPYLALRLGDKAALESAVANWVDNRSEQFVRASIIHRAYYELGNYPQHFQWLKIREQERDLLGWIMDELRFYPDYWNKLREWALAEPEKTRERLELIDDHRQRIDRITEKMIL